MRACCEIPRDTRVRGLEKEGGETGMSYVLFVAFTGATGSRPSGERERQPNIFPRPQSLQSRCFKRQQGHSS